MPGYTTGMPSEIDKNRKGHAKKCFMLVSDIGSSDVLKTPQTMYILQLNSLVILMGNNE